jgi:hypothetical protein
MVSYGSSLNELLMLFMLVLLSRSYDQCSLIGPVSIEIRQKLSAPTITAYDIFNPSAVNYCKDNHCEIDTAYSAAAFYIGSG